MINKNIFLRIYIVFVVILLISIAVLSFLGKKERIGYLSDFKINIDKTFKLNNFSNIEEIKESFTINNKLDSDAVINYILTNESIIQYSYDFRISYYSKVFRNSDIYNVYIDTNEIITNNNIIKKMKIDYSGSPFGNLVSDKIIDFEKIDNVNYVLKIKKNIIEVFILINVLIIIIFFFRYKNKEFLYVVNYINKYRFIVAGIVFILCIIFEISGSSVGIYSNFLNTESGVLFGESRGIRSDEWMVLTPFMLSQYENHTGKFPYFSDTIRGDKTDVFMVYGLPVMDISILFRLFQIGFLFLPPAKGLSFFWIGRLIALFLVSFEIMKLITNKNNKLSLFGAILITFAPTIHWWLAVNWIAELIIFPFLSVILLNLYMKENNFIYRSFYVVAIFICWGNLLFSLYPAWLIPFGYLLLPLYIWVIIENWKIFDIKTKKKDFIIWAVFFVIFIFLVGRIFLKSKETIEFVRNTVYPGSRFETGGGIFLELFRWGINLFLSYKEPNTIMSVCDHSVFIDFFPIPYIYAIYLIFNKKIRDKLLILLSIFSLFFLIYMTIGFPAFLSKISLLSYSPSYRVIEMFGIINIFILIRALYLYSPNVKFKTSIILSILFSLFIIFASYKYRENYLDIFMAAILFIILFIICLSFLKYRNDIFKKIFLSVSSLFLIISSIYINPIRKGLDVIYDSNLYKSIKEISSKDNGLWVSTVGIGVNNIPIIAGAPTINSVNTYPNLKRWKILDPELKYKDIYNRYAHISLNIVDDNSEPQFNLIQADLFELNITLNDLKKINTKYILSDISLEKYNIENIKLNLLKQVDNYYIYELQ
ncbi:hypothetical protein R4I97_04585 [Brachyspira pilosicoli]|uniref:DUF7657 domain-containing protein n=1 Tax=Brachyspira pilosicoli TaxID=52584 RepID=UPI0030057126